MKRSVIPMISKIFCLAGAACVLAFPILGKDGTPSLERAAHEFRVPNLSYFVLFLAPLALIAALCHVRRDDVKASVAGLAASAAAFAVAAWGTATDYFSWRRLPPPTDQVQYLAGFFAMVATWAVSLAFLTLVVIRRRNG